MTASPRTVAGYDIHCLLPNPARPAPDDALPAIARILPRTGGPPWPSRIISATVEGSPDGMPAARTEADEIKVFTSPNGPGLAIHVSQSAQRDTEAPHLSVTLTAIRDHEPNRSR